MARLALERAGYKVLLASGGATGLQMLEDHRAAISLVLLDMSMPGMSGKEVLTRIRASLLMCPSLSAVAIASRTQCGSSRGANFRRSFRNPSGSSSFPSAYAACSRQPDASPEAGSVE